MDMSIVFDATGQALDWGGSYRPTITRKYAAIEVATGRRFPGEARFLSQDDYLSCIEAWDSANPEQWRYEIV